MTTFVLVTTILSVVLMVGFVALSVRKYGLLSSYSSYNIPWDEACPIHNAHLWSIVTFVIAFLFMPATVELGANNPLQFLGFFVPLYLFIVAVCPITEEKPGMNEYEKKEYRAKRVVHVAGAIGCAVAITLWLILVCHLWWVLLSAIALVMGAAISTKTFKRSYIFWGEMVLFLSGYSAILISML